jgi:hypothetical protein
MEGYSGEKQFLQVSVMRSSGIDATGLSRWYFTFAATQKA